MSETLDLIGKGLCIFLAAMLILFTSVAVAYLILNLGNKVDAVPIVRCEDCVHKDVPCPLYGGSQFFCAYGERKTE